MKKLRFILLSAVLVAVFGFSFIGCSNNSSNGGSSNHDMTIQLKDASGTTVTYYADYAADDNFARVAGPEMIVFNSDGTEITDGSVSIEHRGHQNYKLSFNDETGRWVKFQTTEPYEFTQRVNSEFEDTKKIVKITINGNQYSLVEED